MKIFDFIVNNCSVYMSLCGACLVYASCLLFGVEPRHELMIIIFLTIYSIYTLGIITDKAEDEINAPERATSFEKYKKYLIPSIPIAYLSALFIAYYVSGIKMVGVVLLFLILFLLYGVKWIPATISKYRRLKEIIGIKNITVALAWALISVFLPVIYFDLKITETAWVIFIFILFRIIINNIFFDFKDVKGDKAKGILTIPSVFGVRKTLIFLVILNTLLGIFIFMATLNGLLPPLAHLINLSTIYCYGYLYLLNKIDAKFLSYIIVDGELIVIGILAFLGSILF